MLIPKNPRAVGLAYLSLLFCLLFVQKSDAQCDTMIFQDFNQWDNRRYSIADAKSDFNNQIKPWTAGSYRGIDAPGADASLIDAVPQETRIVDGTLRAEYKKNDASGRAGGFLFDPYFDGVEEAYLEYKVKFDDDFFWATGGKLPGLGGSLRGINSETEGRGAIPSGCGYNDDGFSARLMWRRNRAQDIPPYLILYSYFAEKADGSPRQETSDCGDGYRLFTGLEDDKWYTVRQYIKLNTPGERDGVVVIWVDNEEVFRNEALLIRKADKGNLKINALVMHTYRGGARTDTVWHSPRDEFAFFDDFKVWTGGLACMGINEKPAVGFTTPAADTNYMVGDDIEVAVAASDTDGSVAKVSLYLNDTLVRAIDSAPYAWGGSSSTDTLLQNMPQGVYVLKAVAEDNEGSTNSSERRVVVGDVATAPTIGFTTPEDGSQFTTADNIVVNAVANDENGEIVTVTLFIDGTFIRQERVAPYEWGHLPDNDPVLKNMAPGTYVLRVEAADNDGETAGAEITITVVQASSTAEVNTPKLSIRPNPAVNQISLRFPPELLNKTFQVFTSTGKLLREKQATQSVETLAIDTLPAGVYYIVVGSGSYRFVKL